MHECWIEDVWGDALTTVASETGLDIAGFPNVCPWLLTDVVFEDWMLDAGEATVGSMKPHR